ncbi:cytochrome P450 [Cryptosporangium aurantiacum]|uniref:Cytochrome P450 n=1 Tax=Cryptosporangium aurantiacum TaxID=134849 RepID=A0A1M7R435_9ACTN|nr:cytochrome P450 [Cryptosporangium aurantiacum]SHN39743.1 Cytochrome P450 [Cryptosporangium aurantiacum]
MTATPTVTAIDVDERGIPSIDPELMPRVVRGVDWRAQMDALREAFPYFRVGTDKTIWVTRWEAARDVFADQETYYEPNWVEAFGSHDALLDGSGFQFRDGFDPAAGLKRQLRLRQAVMEHFSPKYIQAWQSTMHEIATDLLARFSDRGECDFVNEFSKFYFPYVSARWLGAPQEDWDTLVHWQHEIFQLKQSSGDDRMLHMSGEAMNGVLGYINKLMDDKRAKPDESFTSYVLQASIDGRQLTEEEARGVLTITVLGSGHTVTSHLGETFRHLATHPPLQQMIAAHPDSIDQLAEEMLRLYSPFGHSRTVTRDVELHGLQLHRGDQVFMMYTMANRDPRCPGFGSVDVERKPNPHLAFNFGPRRCIGIHWARISRNIAIEEWHRRIPSYRIKDGVELTEQIYAGTGFPSLPLVWG